MAEKHRYLLQVVDHIDRPTNQPTGHCHKCDLVGRCKTYDAAQGGGVTILSEIPPVDHGSHADTESWRTLARRADLNQEVITTVRKELDVSIAPRNADAGQNLGNRFRLIGTCRKGHVAYIKPNKV